MAKHHQAAQLGNSTSDSIYSKPIQAQYCYKDGTHKHNNSSYACPTFKWLILCKEYKDK